MSAEEREYRCAVIRMITITNADGREITLEEVSRSREATPGLHTLSRAALRSWDASWTITAFRARPVHTDPWGAPGTDAEYRMRVAAMIALAREAGLAGTDSLARSPLGWLPIFETSVAELVRLKRLPGNEGATLEIRQVKEKFGALRLYLDAGGSDEYRACAHQVSDWAGLCSEGRCMLTGQPGKLRGGAWRLTLSDEAEALRSADSEAFGARMYPS